MSDNNRRSFPIDMTEVMGRFLKYAMEGIVVALAAYTIPNITLDMNEVVSISLVAMCTFSLLDYFAPGDMGKYARMGAGAGIGANLVGFPGNQPAARLA